MSSIVVSVVIPTRNRAGLLQKCLRRLEEQSVPKDVFEVVVVDDGSVDDTRRMLEAASYDMNLKCIFAPHRGAASARNEAARAATGNILLFLGDDMMADPGVVAAHQRAHEEHPDEYFGVLGNIEWVPELRHSLFQQFLGEPDCPYQFSFSGFDAENVPPGRMYGSHHSVKRCFFQRHGGFDPAFALPAFDDAELECRYRMSGFRLVYCGDARVHHDHRYDLRSFCHRMHTVGRCAVQLYRRHPESISITDVATFMTLCVDEDELADRIERLCLDVEQLEAASQDTDRSVSALSPLYRAWNDVIVDATALGAQDAMREWTTSSASIWPVPEASSPDEPVPTRLTAVVAAHQGELGLWLVPVDGVWAPTEVSGRQAFRLLRGSAAQRVLYFRAEDRFLGSSDGSLIVSVEYLDADDFTWTLEYDSWDTEFRLVLQSPGAFKPAIPRVRNENTGEWKRVAFRLDDWRFTGRCHGADFRISVEPAAASDLYIRKVEVETAATPSGTTHAPRSSTRRRRTRGVRSPPIAPGSPVDFEPASRPDVSIVIPVHGQLQFTAACLRALRETTDGAYEIIIVDNASTDGTADYLTCCRGIRVVRMPENVGFGAACNRGASEALSDRIVFLNNDTISLPGWLAALRGVSDGDPRVGIVGAKLLYPRGLIQHAGVEFLSGGLPFHPYVGELPHDSRVASTRRVPAVTGACMLVRNRDFEGVEGFDERFRNGYEDIDLCLKLARRGLHAVYCAESVLYHYTSSTPGRFGHEHGNLQLFLDTWSAILPSLLGSQSPLGRALVPAQEPRCVWGAPH